MNIMSLQITAIYAALLGLLFLFLSAMVSKHRLRGQVSLGDGDDASLGQAIRAQANFAEYVPIAIILIGLAEVFGAGSGLMHGLAGGLFLGRVLHAWGMYQPRAVHSTRKIGIILTWLVILVASVFLLYKQLG
jgi:uncharacterized membrane protein YecN with MAPEG domain